MNTQDRGEQLKITNWNLLLPYYAPYFAYVIIGNISEHHLSIEWNYAIRIIIVSAILSWAWRWYIPLPGPKNSFISVCFGVIVGLIGFMVWIFILRLTVNPIGKGLTEQAFYLKLIATLLIVPVFEELLMRGYILRFSFQWDVNRKNNVEDPLYQTLHKCSIDNVAPGAWSVWAVVISTIAFTIGHNIQAWPSAFIYGLIMSCLWIIRKDLISSIVAHAITNLILSLYVRSTGQWGLW